MTTLLGRFLCLCFTSSTLQSFESAATVLGPVSVGRISTGTRVTRVMSTSDHSSSVGLGDIGGKTEESADPSIKSWRTLIDTSISKSRKMRGGNYVQIATVDKTSNEPRCRTVVFRGFLNLPSDHPDLIECGDQSCVMKMITDNRSNKVMEVQQCEGAQQDHAATAEMVWWFSKSSEQYRIRGKLRFVGGADDDSFLTKARKEQWGNLSDMAREQFFWKEPGVSYTGESKVPAGGRGEDGKVLAPPDTFLLMLLYPTRVHYLKLGDNYAQVDEVDNKTWSQKRVNP